MPSAAAIAAINEIDDTETASEKIARLRRQVVGLATERTELRSLVAAKHAEIDEMQDQLFAERARHADAIAALTAAWQDDQARIMELTK